MRRLRCSVLIYLFLITGICECFEIIGINRQVLYSYSGSVSVGAKAPQDDDNPAPPSSGWRVTGKLTLQRQTAEIYAVSLAIDEVMLNNSGDTFHQNKEMFAPYKPFKVIFGSDGTISHIAFKESDPIWSKNFKRAIASALQIQGDSSGAFVTQERGIHGQCSTEYFIANKTDSIAVRKTPELKTCSPFAEAIHSTRSNVPPNLCEFDFQKNVIAGSDALYRLDKTNGTDYVLSLAHVKGTTLIHTFESTGEAQYINSELVLSFLSENIIENAIDIETGMSDTESTLEIEPPNPSDPTGGRHPQLQETLIGNAAELFNVLAEGLEGADISFQEPYDSTVSNIIRIMSQMDFDSLQKLFNEVDIGTSYRQETIRNIFFEIVPRIGTKSSVLLTRDLVINKLVKPTTAVQLLISLPFHIYELSYELVKECESFLTLGPDRPDVRQAAALSYATLIHNAFSAGRITKDIFEYYVQKYFNLYLGGFDYEQKMLYLQALSNLQLGNVANYLDPIIREEGQDNDIKFLAAWATMPLAHTRPEKIYELYWPIFESKSSTLEMRIAALTLLLISNPTPARLISLHRIIQDETCPHMINYYRTTIKSISETTYPCYQHLRRMFSYMYRHLPPSQESRYWVTGNYIFDYRDSKFGIGAMLQAFLVGDPVSDLPVVGYFKFDTEALGRFTGQLALYIKARGLPDAVLDRIFKLNAEHLKLETLSEILKQMHAPVVPDTPLHLEFIVQMEGKTVLSYYLNQKTFHNLTYGDLINRLNFLIRADSHINMQTVRWPFMTKFNVPTVLGTAADVLLETTVLTSLRGNITQQVEADMITRSNQIDVRYSSYASCRSRSYNPFLNLEHDINREQGFLVYVPVNNEMSVNISNKLLTFSFSRAENLTSGLSFKSRSITSTRGFITRSAMLPYEQTILPERKKEIFQLLMHKIQDLGISVSINTNLNELNNHKVMLLKSEFMENGFSSNMIINAIMYLFGVAQLSSIHIGNDRNFSLLVHNTNFTKIDGAISGKSIDGPGDKEGYRLDFSLTHTTNVPSVPLHKWDLVVNLVESTRAKAFKLTGIIKRTNNEKADEWKACAELNYKPFAFLKKPYTLSGAFVFGNSYGQRGCPLNASKIEFSATAGTSFNLTNPDAFNNTSCPLDVLKFDPPPNFKNCPRENFESVTAITNYAANVKFRNMPEKFSNLTNRLDHLLSALSEEKVEGLNITEKVDVNVYAPANEYLVSIRINDAQWQVYHLPLIPKLDSKYDTINYYLHDIGLKRSCSVVKNILNSFDNEIVDIETYVGNRTQNCGILLAADCSASPKMAIIVVPVASSNNDLKYSIKVYTGGNYFTFEPSNQVDGQVLIEVNGERKFDILREAYQYPPFEKFYDVRVEVNEQNIMTVENTLLKSLIHFDMSNIFHVEIFGVYKDKMCGLCSLPLNPVSKYSVCPESLN